MLLEFEAAGLGEMCLQRKVLHVSPHTLYGGLLRAHLKEVTSFYSLLLRTADHFSQCSFFNGTLSKYFLMNPKKMEKWTSTSPHPETIFKTLTLPLLNSLPLTEATAPIHDHLAGKAVKVKKERHPSTCRLLFCSLWALAAITALQCFST